MNAYQRFCRAFHAAEHAIVRFAAGELDYQPLAEQIRRSLARLDDRTNAPEIRGDSTTRHTCWNMMAGIREAWLAAQETGAKARAELRQLQLAALRETESRAGLSPEHRAYHDEIRATYPLPKI